MRWTIRALACLFFVAGSGQDISKEKIDRLADEYFLKGITTLNDFLTLPNYGGIPDNIDRNLRWCEREFQDIDFETELLVANGIKHLFAQRIFQKNAPTILFYLQIDGQPVDPSKWSQENPYKPVLKECDGDDCKPIPWNTLTKDFNPNWKIFARSASDSKGPAVAFLQTLRILHEKHITPDFNIKVIMDFQEELGSPALPVLVKTKREVFTADAMLVMDGTRPPSNLPTLTFGARGIVTMKFIMYGPRKDLHSGQYGNYAPNPVFHLSRLWGNEK